MYAHLRVQHYGMGHYIILSICYSFFSGQSCGVTYTTPTGTLTSENYPAFYPINSDCSNIISVQDARAIQIKFNTFDTEDRYDFLYYGIGTNPSANLALGSFDGSVVPDDFEIPAGTVWFLFQSDDSVIKQGFSLTWTAVLGEGRPVCVLNILV